MHKKISTEPGNKSHGVQMRTNSICRRVEVARTASNQVVKILSPLTGLLNPVMNAPMDALFLIRRTGN